MNIQISPRENRSSSICAFMRIVFFCAWSNRLTCRSMFLSNGLLVDLSFSFASSSSFWKARSYVFLGTINECTVEREPIASRLKHRITFFFLAILLWCISNRDFCSRLLILSASFLWRSFARLLSDSSVLPSLRASCVENTVESMLTPSISMVLFAAIVRYVYQLVILSIFIARE